MAKLNLTEVLCQYAETQGLDPSEDDDLYGQLEELANECIDTIDLIAHKNQQTG